MTPNFPTMWLSGLAVAGGLALLVAGGELMVSGAIRLATRLGMSSLLIGLTVVAFGTSMPEFFVSLSATFQDHPDIMVGNVVGSNIANIGLILGTMVLLAPVSIHFSKIKLELALLIATSLLLLAIAAAGFFSRFFGVVFVTALLLYTLTAYRAARRTRKEAGARGRNPAASFAESYGAIGMAVLGGLLLMAYGSDFFIDGAVDIARRFEVSELVIGLTLAAVGTSLPELASSLSALRRRQGDLVVGNVLGSNLFNLLMVMGGTALLTPFAIGTATLSRDLPVMLGFTLFLVPVLFFRHGLARWHGGLLFGAYLGYLIFLA